VVVEKVLVIVLAKVGFTLFGPLPLLGTDGVVDGKLL